MVFRGINNPALDAKGRMAMPARYREKLMESCAGRLVVTVYPDGCLLVYPLHEWEGVEEQLNALPGMNKKARSMQRLLVGYATEVELDGQGRFLLPTMLREFASLSKKCVLIGQGKKFEIWDEQIWSDKQAAWKDEASADEEGELPAALLNLSL